jgi:hypothetical protein
MHRQKSDFEKNVKQVKLLGHDVFCMWKKGVRKARWSSGLVPGKLSVITGGSTGVGSDWMYSELAFLSFKVTVYNQMETFKKQLETRACGQE